MNRKKPPYDRACALASRIRAAAAPARHTAPPPRGLAPAAVLPFPAPARTRRPPPAVHPVSSRLPSNAAAQSPTCSQLRGRIGAAPRAFRQAPGSPPGSVRYTRLPVPQDCRFRCNAAPRPSCRLNPFEVRGTSLGLRTIKKHRAAIPSIPSTSSRELKACPSVSVLPPLTGGHCRSAGAPVEWCKTLAI